MANIFNAIEKTDIKSLEKLITEKNVNKNIDDKSSKEEYTPLTYACEKGNLKVVNTLIEKGATVNTKDGETYTPLYKAVLAGKLDVTKLLIEKEAEVNKIGRNHYTAAFAAVEKDRLDILEYLVSKKADLNVTQFCGGLVIHAVKYVSAQCFDYLLQQKVNVNTVNDGGKQNVFFEAVFYYENNNVDEEKKKLIQMLEKLHKAGADINFLAARTTKKLQESALHHVARHCSPFLIELLLKMKPKINLKTETGDTALHSLFYRDKKSNSPKKRKMIPFQCIELLLKHGADPNIANKSGNTPFMYMMATYLWDSKDDGKVLELFLKHKADINAKGLGGDRPLHSAAQRCTPAICEMLIKNKADINALNDSRETPLHSSTQQMAFVSSYKERSYDTYKSNSVTYWLLKNGAKILKNDEGDYPHFLSTKNLIHDFHAMVEFKCDINTQAKNGNTILHAVAERGDKDDLIQLIEKNKTGKEFDFSLKDKDGKTILDIAKEEGWKDVKDCIQKLCKDGGSSGLSGSKSNKEEATKSKEPSKGSKSSSSSTEAAKSKESSNTKSSSNAKESTKSKESSKETKTSNSKESTKPKESSKTTAKPSSNLPASKSSSSSTETAKSKESSNTKSSSNAKESTKSKEPSKETKTSNSKESTKPKESSKPTAKPSSNSESKPTKKQRHDVMISYQWDHQEAALKVRDYLRKQGIKVWIDTEQMSGDIFTEMAEAVVGSRVVLMCLSSKYETSDNCTKEYEYTAKKKRPFIPVKVEDSFEPSDGCSLDIILGMKLYYEIEKKQDFDANMPKVYKAVQEFLKN